MLSKLRKPADLLADAIKNANDVLAQRANLQARRAASESLLETLRTRAGDEEKAAVTAAMGGDRSEPTNTRSQIDLEERVAAGLRAKLADASELRQIRETLRVARLNWGATALDGLRSELREIGQKLIEVLRYGIAIEAVRGRDLPGLRHTRIFDPEGTPVGTIITSPGDVLAQLPEKTVGGRFAMVDVNVRDTSDRTRELFEKYGDVHELQRRLDREIEKAERMATARQVAVA